MLPLFLFSTRSFSTVPFRTFSPATKPNQIMMQPSHDVAMHISSFPTSSQVNYNQIGAILEEELEAELVPKMYSMMLYDSDMESYSVDGTASTESESISTCSVEPTGGNLYPDYQHIIRIDELGNDLASEEEVEAKVSNKCIHCQRDPCCMVEFEEEFSTECSLLKETYNRQVAGDQSLSPKLRHHRKHHYHLRCRQWICLKMNEFVQEGFPFRQRRGLRGVDSQINWLLEYPICISNRVIQEFSYPEYTDSEYEYDSDNDLPDDNVGAPLPRFSISGRRAYAEFIHSGEPSP